MDLLAVQGTLKRLLQHHSSKASILQCSAFFIIHLSHPYWTLEWVEWVSISFSRGPCRDQTAVSCTAGRFFTTEPSGKLLGGKLNHFKKGLTPSSKDTGSVSLHQGSRFCSYTGVGEGHGKLSRPWMRGQAIIAGFTTNPGIGISSQ